MAGGFPLAPERCILIGMMSSSRRSFLAGAVTFRLAGQALAQSINGRGLAVGFIGSGVRGKELIDEFTEVPGVRGVAVCDLYDGCLERAKEQLGASIQTTKDYRAVLDNPQVQAVCIATPDHLHERMVMDALSAGKHVYIEKPISWSFMEGERMAAASAARPKQVLQVGSQGKTSALTAKAREIVASGQLGKLNMVRLSEHRNTAEGAWLYPVPPDASEKTIDWAKFLGPRPSRPFRAETFFRWRCWWEFSGGVATDLFVHQFTTLHEILNVKHPSAAVSMGGIMRWNDGRDVPDVMNSMLEYPEGFMVDLYVNQCNSGNRGRGVWIMGDQGAMQVDGGRLTVFPEPVFGEAMQYGSQNFPKRLREAYLKSFEGKPGTQRREPVETKIARGPSHVARFVESVVDNKPSKENALDGHYAAGAAQLCNHAYRNRKRAEWWELRG